MAQEFQPTSTRALAEFPSLIGSELPLLDHYPNGRA